MSLSIPTASTPQGAGMAKPGLLVSDNTRTFHEWLSAAANLE
jgi:hypothetical protein